MRQKIQNLSYLASQNRSLADLHYSKDDSIRLSQINLVLSLFALKKSEPMEIIEAMKEKEKILNGKDWTEEEKNKKILHHITGKFLILAMETTPT